jgi:uncharacterized protein (DUF58 family)
MAPLGFLPQAWQQRIMQLKWFRAGPRDDQPFTVTNRRIYVLPTRFGLFIGLSLAVLNLGALNYNNNAALLMGFIVISLCNNSLIASHLSLLGLRIQSLPIAPVFAGQACQLAVRLDHAKAWKPNLIHINLHHQSAIAGVQSDNRGGQAVLQIPTNRRGMMAIDRIRLFTQQPLGLAKAWAYLNLHECVLVYPVPRGKPLGAQFKAESSHSGRQIRMKTDQPHHLREFKPGDSRKQIAWKASARTETLQVREYENAGSDDLALDWRDLQHMGYEQRIEQLCLWVLQADQKQLRYALKLPGKTLPSASGPEHKRQCLEALALLPHER